MRLSSTEVAIIRKEVRAVPGPDAHVNPFGSRANDEACGGDIDLMVGMPEAVVGWVRKSSELVVRLKMRLGDQSIDVLVLDPERGSIFQSPCAVAPLRRGSF